MKPPMSDSAKTARVIIYYGQLKATIESGKITTVTRLHYDQLQVTTATEDNPGQLKLTTEDNLGHQTPLLSATTDQWVTEDSCGH